MSDTKESKVAEQTVDEIIDTVKQYVGYVKASCEDPRVASAVADMFWDAQNPDAHVGSAKNHAIEMCSPSQIENGEAIVEFNLALSLPNASIEITGYDDKDEPTVEWR